MPQLIQWDNQDYQFKNFICYAIMRAVKAKYQINQEVDKETGVDFIENLLKPRIYAYVQNPVIIYKKLF